MIARLTSGSVLLLAVLVGSHPAVAQETEPALLAPPAPPSEVASVVFPQVLVGTLATFVGGVSLLLIAAVTDSTPMAYASVAATPGIGGLVVCKLGQTSDYYQGSCVPPLVGAYVGAVTLGIGMAYVGAAFFSPPAVDAPGARDTSIGAAEGAVLGILVGTAVGATVAWHLEKHPRGSLAPITLGPPAPPPAALAAWAELRPRAAAPRASDRLAIPLLSLRF